MLRIYVFAIVYKYAMLTLRSRIRNDAIKLIPLMADQLGTFSDIS